MTSDLGYMLRQWRSARSLSMEAAARQAGVTRVTLHRWETGQFRPRLPELESLLRSLEVTPGQRRQALSLLEAPRAAALLREETARETQSRKVSATVAGGLLHALRLRRGWTLEDTARGVGVHKGTLSRWERGEAWPAAERLHALCRLLGASVSEQTALESEPTNADAAEESPTVEAIYAELQRVCLLAPHDPEEALKDLLFLRLEALAWPLSSRSEGTRLLSNIRAAYANHLAVARRYGEASRWADRALEQPVAKKDDVWWLYAVQARSRSEGFGRKRPMPRRGFEILRACLPRLTRPDLVEWVMQNIGEYAALTGDHDAALRLSAQACQVVQASELRNEVFVRQCDHAALLLSAGRAREALEAVPPEIVHACDDSLHIALYPDHQVRMALHCVEALQSLRETQAAHDWLGRAYRMLDDGYLNSTLQIKFRAQAEHLARLF